MRSDGYKSAVHEAFHVADRIHGAEQGIFLSEVIVEYLATMRLVQVVGDGISLVAVFMGQILVGRCLFGQLFDEARNFLPIPVPPRSLRAPMRIKPFLYFAHLTADSFFGILLHPAVECGINFQSVAIEVCIIFLAPFLQFIGYGFAEIECRTSVIILLLEFQNGGKLPDGIQLMLVQHMVFIELSQYHIPS